MEDPVLDGRHFPFLDRLHHFLELAGMIGPIRKIEFVSPLGDVVSDQPRARCNVAVPGPIGFVAMALETMLLHQRTCLRAAPIRLGHDGWIRAVVAEGNELDEKEKHDCPADQDQNKSF